MSQTDSLSFTGRFTFQVEADGYMEILLVQLIDRDLRVSNGDCCEADCTSSCGNYFVFYCRLGRDYDAPPCLDRITTGPLLTANTTGNGHERDFTPGESLGNGVTNPVQVSFRGPIPVRFDSFSRLQLDDYLHCCVYWWQEVFFYKIEAWNSVNPYSSGLLIGLNRYKSNAHASASFEYSHSSGRYRSYITGWRLSCSPNFYLDDCSLFCAPKDDSSGHFNCSSNGTMICLQGWHYPSLHCTSSNSTCISQICAVTWANCDCPFSW